MSGAVIFYISFEIGMTSDHVVSIYLYVITIVYIVITRIKIKLYNVMDIFLISWTLLFH